MSTPAPAAAAAAASDAVDAVADAVGPRAALVFSLTAAAALVTYLVVRYVGRQLDAAVGVVQAERFANEAQLGDGEGDDEGDPDEE